jgi:hypothetical protein
MVETIMRVILEPYLDQEHLNLVTNLIIRKSYITYQEGDRVWTQQAVSGLGSGVKITSILGSLINMAYMTLAEIEPIDVKVLGDDNSMINSSVIDSAVGVMNIEGLGLPLKVEEIAMTTGETASV